MMRLNGENQVPWLESFQPELFDLQFDLEPGHVLDRSDGKLVHLDGVNFSRAWNLYSIVTILPDSYRDVKYGTPYFYILKKLKAHLQKMGYLNYKASPTFVVL